MTRKSDFSKTHPFGTTEGQYDVYYGIVWGTRTAFLAGIGITAVTAFIGVAWGTLAAYFGRWLDLVLMRITDVFQAFPFLIAAITIAAVLQPKIGRSILTAAIALIVFGWMGYSRLIRGGILSVKERDYGQAARNWIPRLNQYWWIILYPGLALILSVLAWNLVGDALRDTLDPRLRGRITV